jgi:outer membrane protein assembly factor BamA
MILKKWLFVAFSILIACFSHAQSASDSLKTPKRSKLFVLPLVFYSPETKFGAGASGILTFHFKHDSLSGRTSSIQFGAAYTERKQILFYLPFQLFLHNEDYTIYGETGYYIYNYFFFGIGNHQPINFKETYDVTYPRLRLNIMKQLSNKFYGGIRYSIDDYKITKTDTSGELHAGDITGSYGGVTSGIGAVLKFDNRDNLFYPTKGYYAEFFFQADDKWTGSRFNFLKYSFDASTYFTTKFHHTLALNFYTVLITGNPPFYQMSLIGGTKKMRGYYEGRYRDKDVTMLQAEYRAPIYRRLGLVAFAGYGLVSDKIKNYSISNLKFNYGGGLRFMVDKKQKINIRLDYGIGEKSGNFYLTLTEAF